MKKQKKSMQIGLGVSSILMIFVVLCMTILSLLSYQEAKQKDTISNRLLTYNEAYAQSDAAMQFMIGEAQGYGARDIASLLANEAFQLVCKQYDITYQQVDQQLIVTKQINDTQMLQAQLTIDQQAIFIQKYIVKETGE